MSRPETQIAGFQLCGTPNDDVENCLYICMHCFNNHATSLQFFSEDAGIRVVDA
jgi:hypothetical protein